MSFTCTDSRWRTSGFHQGSKKRHCSRTLETGNSVEVKINDRGPYAKGRDIDLSKGAAKELGMTKDGVAPVKIEAEVAPGVKSNEKK